MEKVALKKYKTNMMIYINGVPNLRAMPQSEMDLLVRNLSITIDDIARTRRRPKPKEKPP